MNPLVDNNWWGLLPGRGSAAIPFPPASTTASATATSSTRAIPAATSTSFTQYGSQIMLNEVPGAIHRRAPNKALAASWVRTFSPTLFNDLMASVSRDVQWRGNGR